MKDGVQSGLPDIIAPGLKVLFCGINPGATAALAGRHFVSGTNRFWRVLYLSGLTPCEIQPTEDRRVIDHGIGLTTFISRPTPGTAELARREYDGAGEAFGRKVRAYKPETLAFLGKAAWASLACTSRVSWGPQPQSYEDVRVWVLPNPSGRNLHFTLDALIQHYREFRESCLRPSGSDEVASR